MTETDELTGWLTAAAVTIAAALFLWQALAPEGWIEVAFGPFYLLFWALVLAWVACSAVVLRRLRRWWVLLTAPVVLFPVLLSGGLIVACVRGDCL